MPRVRLFKSTNTSPRAEDDAGDDGARRHHVSRRRAGAYPDARELGDALREAVASLPIGVYNAQDQERVRKRDREETILAPDYVKENAFTLHDGGIAVRARRDTHAADHIGRRNGHASPCSAGGFFCYLAR